MSRDARLALGNAVRSLRSRMIVDLHDAVESRYLLAVPARNADLDPKNASDRETLKRWLRDVPRRVSGAAEHVTGGRCNRSPGEFPGGLSPSRLPKSEQRSNTIFKSTPKLYRERCSEESQGPT